MMTTKSGNTLLRLALREESTLLKHVRDGFAAVKNTHREYFDQAIRTDFADSLELDEALRKGHEQEKRWDYLLGHAPSCEIVAVEPHSARQDQVASVIKKQTAARAQLRTHLREGKRVTRWLWVASGRVHFADTEKTRRLLDQNGILFVGARVAAKHLPAPRSCPRPNQP